MLSFIVAIDQDVVKKYQHEPPEEGSENFIHDGLKGCGGVSQTEGHY